ncbi:MAG: DNA repair protein RadC [Bacteroidales bacterium]
MENLPIKEWAMEDRPREKMLQKGVSALSDAELLAILIGKGNAEESAVHLAQRILRSVDNNLNILGKRSIHELANGFKGIGMVKAVTLIAAMELGRRRSAADAGSPQRIISSKDAYLIFHPLLCDLLHEEFWILLTNRAAKVIGKTKISQGGGHKTAVDIRLILKAALHALAFGIILCHNHPSGNVRPSGEDDALTQQIKNAAQLMGIQLLDHIVLSGNTWYSYADEGRL